MNDINKVKEALEKAKGFYPRGYVSEPLLYIEKALALLPLAEERKGVKGWQLVPNAEVQVWAEKLAGTLSTLPEFNEREDFLRSAVRMIHLVLSAVPSPPVTEKSKAIRAIDVEHRP